MVDSWSRAANPIQMYPDRDTIAQVIALTPSLLSVLAIKCKYTTKHLMYGPSGN